MAKKSTPAAPTTETARKIWLAGIGAYGRAFSEAQGSLARLGDETSRVFEDLVEKGEQIESAVEKKGREVAARVAPNATPFDERIKRMRERIGLADQSPSLRSEITDIEMRLDRIEAKLDQLLSGKKPAAAARKATKKKTS